MSSAVAVRRLALGGHGGSAWSVLVRGLLVSCLEGVPTSVDPGRVERRLLGGAPGGVAVRGVPDMTAAWATTSALVFVRQRAEAEQLSARLAGDPRQTLRNIHSVPAALRFLAQLHFPPPPAFPSLHPRSGRTVLLVGIPLRLSHFHVERSLINLGLPIEPVAQLSVSARHHRGLYWPTYDPLFPDQEPCGGSASKVARSQLVYLPTPALASHLTSRLHRSQPAWLGRPPTQAAHSSPPWQIKARVIY